MSHGALRPTSLGLAPQTPDKSNDNNKSKNFLNRVGVGLAPLANDRKQWQIEQKDHYNSLRRLQRW